MKEGGEIAQRVEKERLARDEAMLRKEMEVS